MSSIKILHCLHSKSWGGLEIYSVELIVKLHEAGVKQKVLCSLEGKAYEELKKTGIELITFSGKLSKFKEAALIRKTLKADPSITHLHSHTRLDMWACALALWNRRDIKHVYNLYMNAVPKKDFVHKLLFSKVDALCSSSESILADVKKNFPIAPEKLHLIRYGRKTEEFIPYPEKRAQLRVERGARDSDMVVGTLCRIDPGKGVKELVAALDHLKDDELAKMQLWVVGDLTISGKNPDGSPVYEEPSLQLENWIRTKMQEPRYQGRLHRIPFQKEYIPYIDALDVFSLVSYNETYSLSVLDAMMMAKPVIGTNSGGTPEQVGQNERGYLVTPHSSESIAEAFRFYLNNKAKIQEQGVKARQWPLTHHSWEKTLSSFLNLYKTL